MRKALFPTAFVRVLTAVAFALAAVLAVAGSATASSTQPTMLQDDAQLVLGSQAQRDARLDEFKRLGVDIVKVRLSWRGVAPSNTSRTKPDGFNGADPAAYPAGAWDPYDAIVRGAEARGMRVFFQLGGNAPEWATPGKRRSAVYKPKAGEFRAFVQAVGTRYSGSYGGSAGGTPTPPGGGGLPVPLPRADGGDASAAQAGDALPRVSLYSVWNEPNLKSWLAPQRAKGVPVSPRIYRGLLYAASDGLSESDHGSDELLLGELLPYVGTGRGNSRTRPLAFLRELACVKRNFRPYKGKAAKKRGCKAKFRKLPGTGLAFHPYTLGGGPNVPVRNRDDASISTLSRVTKTLDRLRGRVARRKMPVWITEFGFQSRPPDRYATPLRKIPGFMAQSERIAYGNSRVASFSQYPLVDDRGRGGFQSGLRFANGKAKPRVYKAFQHTIYVRRLSGSRVEVFGIERAADSGNVTIERKRGKKGKWARVATVAVNEAGYFRRNVSGSSSDSFRFKYGSSKSRAAKPARR